MTDVLKSCTMKGRPDRCRELPELDRASLVRAIPGWYGTALLDSLSLRVSHSSFLKEMKF